MTEHRGKPVVFVLDPVTRKLTYKSVQIAHYYDEDIFITEGLVEGDIVSTAGVNKLREGELVTREG